MKSAKDRKAISVGGIVEADETYFLKSQKGARKVKGRLTCHLAPIVAKDALLISDGEKVYGAFAAKQDILHVWIIASKGEHVWRGYHIQNVNAYASGLKTWMVRFRGVATKYVDSYLGWRRNDRSRRSGRDPGALSHGRRRIGCYVSVEQSQGS